MKRFTTFFFSSLLLAAATIQAQPLTGGQTDQQITQQPVQTDTTSGWQIMFSKPGLYFSFVQFPSKDTGYTIASDLTKLILYRSINQGITWDSVSLPPIGKFYFTNSLIGYCNTGSTDSVIWKTTDGGMTWMPHPRNANAAGPIAFSNKDTGVTVGHVEIARTTDGGETWGKIFPQSAEVIQAVSFGDSKTAYAIGNTYYDTQHNANSAGCQKTTDGGFTWRDVYTGVPTDLWCCQALNRDTVIVGSAEGYVGRTTDGGITWSSTIIGPSNAAYEAVSFGNTQHGFIVGGTGPSTGMVFSTIDCGKTWQKQYFPNIPTLTGVSMLTDSIVVVCGDGNIYRTTTAGNFSSASQPPITDFQVQVFPNPTPGLITIQYQLPSATIVSFTFTDVRGVVVANTPPQLQNIGVHQIPFDGSTLANGVYYFQLTTQLGSYTGQFAIQK